MTMGRVSAPGGVPTAAGLTALTTPTRGVVCAQACPAISAIAATPIIKVFEYVVMALSIIRCRRRNGRLD
jgi:hypothetical protein